MNINNLIEAITIIGKIKNGQVTAIQFEDGSGHKFNYQLNGSQKWEFIDLSQHDLLPYVKKPIYITKYSNLRDSELGAWNYMHHVKYTEDGWAYRFRATDEGMMYMISKLKQGGYEVIFTTI